MQQVMRNQARMHAYQRRHTRARERASSRHSAGDQDHSNHEQAGNLLHANDVASGWRVVHTLVGVQLVDIHQRTHVTQLHGVLQRARQGVGVERILW